MSAVCMSAGGPSDPVASRPLDDRDSDSGYEFDTPPSKRHCGTAYSHSRLSIIQPRIIEQRHNEAAVDERGDEDAFDADKFDIAVTSPRMGRHASLPLSPPASASSFSSGLLISPASTPSPSPPITPKRTRRNVSLPSSPTASPLQSPSNLDRTLQLSVSSSSSLHSPLSRTNLASLSSLSIHIEEADDIIVAEKYVPMSPSTRARLDAEKAREMAETEGLCVRNDVFAVSMRYGKRKSQQDFYCVASVNAHHNTAFAAPLTNKLRGAQRSLSRPLSQTPLGRAGSFSAASWGSSVPSTPIAHSLPSLFGCFDGHGDEGAKAAQFCAKMIPEHVSSALASGDDDVAIRHALSESYRRTDTAICTDLKVAGGTTAVCSYLTFADSKLRVHTANVGDSRAVIFRGDRTTVALTNDHTCDRADERSRIEAAGAHIAYTGRSSRVNGILNVTRSLGDAHLKHAVVGEPELHTHDVSDGDDWLIIATDGVWKTLSTQEIGRLIKRRTVEAYAEAAIRARAAEVSECIAEAALAARCSDNICVVAVCLPSYIKLKCKESKLERFTPPIASPSTFHTSPLAAPTPRPRRQQQNNASPLSPQLSSPVI